MLDNKEGKNSLKMLVNSDLCGSVDFDEVEKISKTEPKYKIGDIVDINTWTGIKKDFEVKDVKITYHMRKDRYVWGYELYKEGEKTGLNFRYIPEGYICSKKDECDTEVMNNNTVEKIEILNNDDKIGVRNQDITDICIHLVVSKCLENFKEHIPDSCWDNIPFSDIEKWMIETITEDCFKNESYSDLYSKVNYLLDNVYFRYNYSEHGDFNKEAFDKILVEIKKDGLFNYLGSYYWVPDDYNKLVEQNYLLYTFCRILTNSDIDKSHVLNYCEEIFKGVKLFVKKIEGMSESTFVFRSKEKILSLTYESLSKCYKYIDYIRGNINNENKNMFKMTENESTNSVGYLYYLFKNNSKVTLADLIGRLSNYFISPEGSKVLIELSDSVTLYSEMEVERKYDKIYLKISDTKSLVLNFKDGKFIDAGICTFTD